MKTHVRRMGNSQGVIIPKPLLEEIGMRAGDAVDMKVKKGRIVIAPRTSAARAGWAEDSRKLAAAGDAVRDAPGGDGGLTW
jgi:antitoxin MazE